MDNSEKTWCLIARTLNNEASEADRQELAEILRQDEFLQQQYDLLSRIWKEEEHIIDYQDKQAAQNIISRIIYKAEYENDFELIGSRNRLSRRKIGLAVAASVVIAVVSVWVWINNGFSPIVTDKETIEAKNGSRSRSLLPDGTTVWLNAGSKLYYDGDFTGVTREVKLEGEAFFDVVKQTNRPFIVHASGIDIKVLGTAFNVKSYPEDKTVETTLYRGVVKVFREAESEARAIQLKPNEKLVLHKEAAIKPEDLSNEIQPASAKDKTSFTITWIDSTKKESERLETAWLYSRLEFRGDNFEELARKLERWYNVRIVFTDEKVKQLTVQGSFEKETVEQAFEALKEGFPINYKINKHEISVGSSE